MSDDTPPASGSMLTLSPDTRPSRRRSSISSVMSALCSEAYPIELSYSRAAWQGRPDQVSPRVERGSGVSDDFGLQLSTNRIAQQQSPGSGQHARRGFAEGRAILRSPAQRVLADYGRAV